MIRLTFIFPFTAELLCEFLESLCLFLLKKEIMNVIYGEKASHVLMK